MTTRFCVVNGEGAHLRTFVVAHIVAWWPNTETTCGLLLTSGDKCVVRESYDDVDHTMTRCLEARRA